LCRPRDGQLVMDLVFLAVDIIAVLVDVGVLECVGGGGEDVGGCSSSSRAAGEQLEEDLLTCGDCLREFLLSDIVDFIHHKVLHCRRARCAVTSAPTADNDRDDKDGNQVSQRHMFQKYVPYKHG